MLIKKIPACLRPQASSLRRCNDPHGSRPETTWDLTRFHETPMTNRLLRCDQGLWRWPVSLDILRTDGTDQSVPPEVPSEPPSVSARLVEPPLCVRLTRQRQRHNSPLITRELTGRCARSIFPLLYRAYFVLVITSCPFSSILTPCCRRKHLRVIRYNVVFKLCPLEL